MRQAVNIPVGGMIPEEGFLFVPRPEDEHFLELARSSRQFTVSGCRTMGKSSLVSRWRQTLEEEGVHLAHIDLEGHVGEAASPEAWVEAVAETAFVQLGVDESSRSRRDESGSCATSAARHIARLVRDLLEAREGRVLLVLDEVDFLVRLPYSRALLAGFRAWQVDHSRASEGDRFGLSFIGLRPLQQVGNPFLGTGSPAGRAISMDDFLPGERAIATISEALDLPDPGGTDVARRIIEQAGGQPFMTMLLADVARRVGADGSDAVDAIVDEYLASQRSDPQNLLLHIEDFFLENRYAAFAALSTYLDVLERKRRRSRRRTRGEGGSARGSSSRRSGRGT